MSYICDMCGLPSKKGEMQRQEMQTTRNKQYYTIVLRKMLKKREHLGLLNRYKYVYLYEKDEDKIQKLISEKYELVAERNTEGKEIVKENRLCPRCAKIVGVL